MICFCFVDALSSLIPKFPQDITETILESICSVTYHHIQFWLLVFASLENRHVFIQLCWSRGHQVRLSKAA